MVKFNRRHLKAQIPSWEIFTDQQMRCNNTSCTSRSNDTIHVDGVVFNMMPNLFFHRNVHINTLPPSPPLSLCSLVTPDTPIEPRGIRSGTTATSTYPSPPPTGPVIMEATDSMRVRARAMIWDDVPHIEDSFMCLDSDSESSSDEEEIVDSGFDSSSRRQRLMARASGKLRKVYTQLEKSVEKAEANALRRTFRWAKRGVNKFRPLRILFKGITRRAKEYELFLQREWNVSTFSFMKVSGQNSREASTWSLAGPVVSDEEGPGKPGTRAQFKYPRHHFIDSGSAFSWRGDAVHPDKAILPCIDQSKQHAESYMAKEAKSFLQEDQSPERYNSISAQIAAFRFSTLVPMEILRGWGPTHRVILKTGNASLAQYDLIKLSHIWNQAIGSKYSPSWSASYQPLRGSSDVDVEKLCKLMEEGLHRFTYWSLFARLSMKEKEGAMDEKWWLSFGKKLGDIGHPNSEALYEQLVAVGLEYIDVDALETARALTNALNLVGFPDKELVCQNQEGSLVDKKAEHPVLAQMEKAITSELTGESLAKQAEVSLVTKLQPRRSMSVCQSPSTATSLPISRDGPGEHIVMHSHNCHSARKATVSEAMHGGDLTPQDMCNTTLNIEAPASTEIVPFSPGMMEQVIASLDAAIGQPVSSPEPMKERTPSQIPRPLTMRKSQSTLFKSKSTSIKSSRQKRQDSPHEPASPRITRENGWISAVDIEDFDPANITWEDAVYAGPSHMSNKAKGKLPVGHDLSVINVPSRLYSKGPQPQTLPQSTITSKAVSKPVLPRAGPEPSVKSQNSSAAGPSGLRATRSTSLSNILTRCDNSVETVLGKSISKTTPPRPRAHSHGDCQAGLVARDITRSVSMSSTKKPSDLPTMPGNEAKTSHTSPHPIAMCTVIHHTAPNPSTPPEKNGVIEVKTLRAPLGPGLLEPPLPETPAPRRTAYMPGTFVESDAEFITQRYGPKDVARAELESFSVVTICQETPP